MKIEQAPCRRWRSLEIVLFMLTHGNLTEWKCAPALVVTVPSRPFHKCTRGHLLHQPTLAIKAMGLCSISKRKCCDCVRTPSDKMKSQMRSTHTDPNGNSHNKEYSATEDIVIDCCYKFRMMLCHAINKITQEKHTKVFTDGHCPRDMFVFRSRR